MSDAMLCSLSYAASKADRKNRWSIWSEPFAYRETIRNFLSS
jgi:hypothetical protein